jgi:polyisoprenyl-teichoic acid--peptidoglycan teichoic acid transferase
MRVMPRSRFGVIWRGVAALVVVVGCAAGATATAGLLQFKSVAQDFNLTKALPTKGITPPLPGQPQTLLLIGVDCRGSQCTDGSIGNTDTMMLVRIDDSSSTINALSIPRDLAVQIPGTTGISKINAAYADGGQTLLLQTLKQDVFPDIHVNHILIVDFASFANLINAIGCVYADVDHRYYNYNDGTAGTNFANIDIQPGYQKLCGGSGANLGGANTALAFVRFRHNDSDFVREARQQDFLRWAKQSLPSGQTLLGMKDELAKYFGEDVQTDGRLHTIDGVDELFGLAFNADGSSIKSFPFPYTGTETIGGADDVTFDEAAAEATYQKFMTPTTAPTTPTTVSTTTTPASTGKKGKKGKKKAPAPPTVPAGMRSDPGDGQSQAAQLGNTGLPIYYPSNIPDNYEYCAALTGDCSEGYAASVYAKSYPRSYDIDGQDGKSYPSYAMTLVYGYPGELGELGTGDYFTVQGTTWLDPPILRSPTAVKAVDGKILDEYVQGGALTLVAWHTKKAVYWISNTLENSIPNGQMVAMAASFARAAG